MKGMLTDGECVGADIAYCDVVSCVSFVMMKESTTHITPYVYLRSTLATILVGR